MVKPEKARRVEEMLIHAAKSGALGGKVSEDQFIQMLEQVRVETEIITILAYFRSIAEFLAARLHEVDAWANHRQRGRQRHLRSTTDCSLAVVLVVMLWRPRNLSHTMVWQMGGVSSSLVFESDRMHALLVIYNLCFIVVFSLLSRDLRAFLSGELADGEEDQGYHQEENVLRRARLGRQR